MRSVVMSSWSLPWNGSGRWVRVSEGPACTETYRSGRIRRSGATNELAKVGGAAVAITGREPDAKANHTINRRA